MQHLLKKIPFTFYVSKEKLDFAAVVKGKLAISIVRRKKVNFVSEVDFTAVDTEKISHII